MTSALLGSLIAAVYVALAPGVVAKFCSLLGAGEFED